jgi:hypothetical protein
MATDQEELGELTKELKGMLPTLRDIVAERSPERRVAEDLGRTTQTVSELRGQVSGLQDTLTKDVLPAVKEVTQAAPTLKSLCELYPELCAIRDRLKEAKPPEVPPKIEAIPPAELGSAGHIAPMPATKAHQHVMAALQKAGGEALGRAIGWGDLLDCPDGDCGVAAARALAKRPKLLEELVGQEGVADVLIEALKKSGKLVIEEPPKPPEPKPVDAPAPAPGEEANERNERFSLSARG